MNVGHRIPWLLIVALLTGICLAACTGSSRAKLDLGEACKRVILEPSPFRTASLDWRVYGVGVVLVAQGERCLKVYNAAGKLEERVGCEDQGAIRSLDYTNPIRFSSGSTGYLVMDRSTQILLSPNFQPLHTRAPLEGEDTTGILGDGVTIGNFLYGYLDFHSGDLDEAPWKRGFARVDLSQPGQADSVEFFLNLELEKGGEYERYYHYDVRPYVAALDKKAYFLRLTDEPQLMRATRNGLRVVGDLDLPEGGVPVALHAWQKWFFVLSKVQSSTDMSASRTPAARATAPTWILDQLRPKDGRLLRRVRLPTRARRLQIATGATQWALLEESSEPNLGGDRPSRLITFDPAHLLEEDGDRGGGVDHLCPLLFQQASREAEEQAAR